MNVRFARMVRWWLTSLLVLANAGASHAGPWVLAPGEFSSEVRGERFSTETFLDANGERPPFPSGGALEGRGVRWSNELGWKKRLSFRVDLPFESVTRQLGSGPEQTRTGLSDLLAGFKLRLGGGATALALEANWKGPLGYNRHLSPALGNGRQEAIGLLHFGTAFPGLQAFLQLAGGYRLAIDGIADDSISVDGAMAEADLGFWLGPSVLVSGSYRGFFGSSDQAAAAMSHQVGPQLLYRVDDHLDVFAGSLHTASGENVLHLDRIYVGVTAKKTRFHRLQGFLGNKTRP
jgi:hypothetical protein